MIRQSSIFVVAVIMLFTANVMAEIGDSCFADANVAVNNKSFGQAEIILLNHLQHEEKDTEARFLLARVLSWQQKWPEALKQFDVLLEEQPNSADFLLARANTFEWTGQRKQALQDLEKARELAPDYSELWQSEITILMRDSDMASHRQAKALANEARQQFPDIDWNSLLIAEDTEMIDNNKYTAEVLYGHDELTNNRSPWEIVSAKLAMQTPAKHFAHVQLDSIERFELDDWQIGGSYALPLAESWSLYAGATYSPTHKVIANSMLQTRISKSFPTGLNLHAGISHARYSDTSSQQLYLTGEYYWSEFRVSYTYRLIDVLNAGTGENHNIQFNKFYSSVNMIGASFAAGEDVEFDGSSDPPISDVLTLSIFGRHMFQPQWSLIYSFTYHQQGDFYNRNGFVLGIKFDF